MINDPFTIIISLDNEGKAFGDLYLDDGHSFDFTKGSFSSRQFRFSDNILYSSGTSSYTTGSTIERVIINGQTKEPKSILLQPGNKGLTFDYDKQSKILVIRKLDVSATNDFSLVIQ